MDLVKWPTPILGMWGTIPGNVDLYYGKTVVRKSVLNEQLFEALIELIKEYGLWKVKEEVEGESSTEAAQVVTA